MSEISRSWRLADAAATERLGARLASSLTRLGAVITLSGDLGTGKTTLVRGLLHALGHPGRVRSPTYTLVEPYEIGGRQVLHCDLYRVESAGELEFLGLRERDADGVLLVEWPERGSGALPVADLVFQLAYCPEGREITGEARTEAGTTILGGMPVAGHFL